MYRAKVSGNAGIEVFNPTMHTQAVALLQLETDLRRAIERQEFRIHYQPLVSLSGNRIIGFEALLRWQHPERGLISPVEFMQVAEETELIVPIGWWLLREACRQMQTWQEQFQDNPPLTMSVNFSGKQFLQPGLIEQIDQLLQETALDPKNLQLEITETMLMENTEAATATLEQMRALNPQLYIDDFGTGYSSLSYLHRLPIDGLKIDHSFVSRMDVDSDNLEIVRVIATLAHNLGMDVIAEGVETIEQLAQLKALNCKYGQGNFFSKPITNKAAKGLIAMEPQW
jgi:EAL domain-containing protein (putative c-di-GMP-specific phosphodiesterase class I)